MNQHNNRVQHSVEAYIFDTKFDLILGQRWFRQYKPIPEWDSNVWTLKTPGAPTVRLTPQSNSSSGNTISLISKKQVQRDLKRGEIEEMFLVCLRQPNDLLLNNSSVMAVSSSSTNPLDTQINQLLNGYDDVFQEQLPPKLPPSRNVEHVIETDDATPIRRAPFKMSPLELDELQRQLKDLLAKGFIQPSSSPWGAPVLFVRKKGGALRMCIDYRAINSLCIKRLNTPLPRIDECLERLHGAKYFSQLDLTSVSPSTDSFRGHSQTAFVTRYGSFELKVLPFGLSNSPSLFQRMMNTVLDGYIDKFCLLYLDDCCIFSRTAEELVQHICKS